MSRKELCSLNLEYINIIKDWLPFTKELRQVQLWVCTFVFYLKQELFSCIVLVAAAGPWWCSKQQSLTAGDFPRY